MRITSGNQGIINAAETDDGSIRFAPIGNDRLIINGVDVWRKQYETGAMVEDGLWAKACELMDQVNAHNRKVLDDAREAHFAARAAKAERIANSLDGTRGTYADEGTY